MTSNELSQNTLYRNCQPKEKGQFVERGLNDYLEHLHKMNINEEYRQTMMKEKGDLLRVFNDIYIKNGHGLFNPNGEIDNCQQCIEDLTNKLFFPYKSDRNFVENDVNFEDAFIETDNDPLSVYIECIDNKLNINSENMCKHYFQNNDNKSQLSQQNTARETHNLKAYSADYRQESDIIKFMYKNRIQSSNHDDMINSWFVIRLARGNHQ